MMPDAEDEVVSALESKLASLESVTSMLEKGMSSEDILNVLVGEFEPKVLDKIPVEYYCNCSREKVEKALISIGKKELANIIEEDGKAEMHCHFCNKNYEFNKDELMELLKEALK
jgi:molecular chaperone Hsp33